MLGVMGWTLQDPRSVGSSRRTETFVEAECSNGEVRRRQDGQSDSLMTDVQCPQALPLAWQYGYWVVQPSAANEALMCTYWCTGVQDSNSGTGVQALDTTFQPAAHFRPLIDQVYQELCRRWVISMQGRLIQGAGRFW
jgi:hypothetical protein